MSTTMRAVRAEWTKLRTLTSTGWLLIGAVAATVALGAAITGSLHHEHCDTPCLIDPVKLSLAGIRVGQVAVAILAVMAVTAEYSTRTIAPTVTAVPRRIRVVAAKLAVLVGLTLVTAVTAVALSLVAARLTLPHTGFAPPSWSDHLAVRAATGSVIYLVLIAALGAGIGLLVRDTAGAVTGVLVLLYGAPAVAAFVTNPRWAHRIHRFSPMDAGLSIQATRNLAAEHIGPWAGLGVLAAYAGVAVVAGLLMFCVRDTR